MSVYAFAEGLIDEGFRRGGFVQTCREAVAASDARIRYSMTFESDNRLAGQKKGVQRMDFNEWTSQRFESALDIAVIWSGNVIFAAAVGGSVIGSRINKKVNDNQAFDK